MFFSNGYSDDSIRIFLAQNTKQVETIVISLDGLERTHDQRRPFGRRNSFARKQIPSLTGFELTSNPTPICLSPILQRALL